MWRQGRGRASPKTEAQRQNIIFDFDGTIANTLPLVIEVAEELAVSPVPLTPKLIEKLRGMPAQQAIKYAGIPLRKVPSLLTVGRKILKAKLKQAEPFPDMVSVIRELAKNQNLYVMSSNSPDNINEFLRSYKLDKCFQAVYGDVSVFGKHKSLKKIMAKEHLEPSFCIYVGDETRDIEAAHKIKLPIISVTWGYNNKTILQKFSPDFIINSPTELPKVISKL